MYSRQSSDADSATIDPAALTSPGPTLPSPRGRKRRRFQEPASTAIAGETESNQQNTKFRRIMKPADAPGGQPSPSGAVPLAQTSQTQSNQVPSQTASAFETTQPPKTTPTKSTLKALPTVRDHTTDQLNPAGDEYLPREIDEFGEKKVQMNGTLLGGRTYRCRTFLVPNRGDKLFMLATECARVLSYRDSYLLFNKNRSLFKIIASQAEKDDLVQQEILPFSYRSRQIAIVTARSMFRQFGSRVIENGRRVRDDYWETKARKQGFTENDLAGEKRPGAARAREAAAEAQNSVLLTAPTEIVYSNTPGPYPGAPQPHLIPGMMGGPPGTNARMPALTVTPDLNDTRPRDYSGIIKGGPRQEITGPAYQDQTRPSPILELHSQAQHAAEFSRSVNQQRDMRGDYLQGLWRRPHEQPHTSLTQPIAPHDASIPTSRATNSPHAAASGLPQTTGASSHSPQMMMTGPPYSQSINTQNQTPMRGSNAGLPGGPGYSYPGGQQVWPQTPQTPQPGYGSYTAQAQQGHPGQSPAQHMRPGHGQMQHNMQFPSMGGMPYGGGGQGMYSADQTPRQYMPQGGTPGQPGWSGHQSSPPQHQQWWTQQPQ